MEVWVIDDEFTPRFLTRKWLEKISSNFVVADFSKIQDVVVALRDGASPQYIFLDLNMPGITGWDFLQDYSSLLPENCRVIICSSSSRNSDFQLTEKYESVIGYIEKPINGDQIKKYISI